jgi:uncharacterized protein (TIGR02284 family)
MNSPELNSDAADQAKGLLDGTTNKAKHLYEDTADKAKGLYDDAAGKVKDLYDEAAAKSKDLLDKVPAPVKDAGEKTAQAYNKLTTTQKIVGGALLAAGLSYLVAPKKKGKAKRKTAALDQLLLFVNDRIEGYKRAVAETKDGDLRSYYQQLVGQSQKFASNLNGYLTANGAKPETGTTLKGKLYRKLMDAQALVLDRDEKAILAANVYGEKWAIKAYKQALRRKALKGDARAAVKKQFATSKQTYKKLKELTKQQA